MYFFSEPTELGTFNTSANGSLNAQIRIPGNVPAGFHTVHIYGKNMAGEPVDIFKTVYVAANEIDYDEDGLTNGLDSCPTFDNSGMDSDKDGVDDVCDGMIGESPIAKTSPGGSSGVAGFSNDSTRGSGNITPSNSVLQPANARLNTLAQVATLEEQRNNAEKKTGGEVLSVATDQQSLTAKKSKTGVSILPFLGDNQPKVTFGLIAVLMSFGVVYLRRLVSEQF